MIRLILAVVISLMSMGQTLQAHNSDQKPDIQAVIFDVGGVLVFDELNLWVPAFKKLGAQQAALLGTIATQPELAALIDEYGRGKVSFDQLMPRFAKLISLSTFDEASFTAAFNCPIQSLNHALIRQLQQIKAQGIAVYALSNTNALHAAAIEALYHRDYPQAGLFSDLFQKHYWSFQTGLRKPEPIAFQQVLTEEGLQAKACLLVDDRKDMLAAAHKLGFQTHLYQKSSADNLLKRLGIEGTL